MSAGFSLGVPVPPELQGLTFAEMALVARIQVAVPARKLKFGDRSLTGHVSFFDRTANIAEVANVLPRLAADVKVMEFTAQVGRAANHTYRDFKVRRFKVEHALRWLCFHSPAYDRVTISDVNLALLPADGQLEVTVIQVPEDPEEDDEDLGPAAAQRAPAADEPAATAPPQRDPLSVRRDARQVGAEVTVLPDGQGAPRPGRISAIVANAGAGPLVALQYLDDNSVVDGIPLHRIFIEVETDHTAVVDAGVAQPHEAARDAQAGLAGLANATQHTNAAAARSSGVVVAPAAPPLPAPLIVQHHVPNFLDWSTTPYFFAKAFPTLFLPDRLGDPGNASVPAEFNPSPKPGFYRQSNWSFSDWAEQLLHADGRFVAHETFMFAVFSIKQRQQARACTSFAIKCLPGDAPPDLAAVREALDQAQHAGVDRLGHHVTTYMNSITGTAPYWWKRRREVSDMVRHFSSADNSLPVVFHTASFAEYHMPGLYKVLYECLILFGRPDLAGVINHLRTRQGGPPANPPVSPALLIYVQSFLSSSICFPCLV